MVTAFDVKYGKPNPEPYLMALKKAHLQPNEALVIENAPLGVQAGVAAGIFTIAVNTGPLPDQVLWDEGANLLFPSMPAFNENWEILKQELKNKYKEAISHYRHVCVKAKITYHFVIPNKLKNLFTSTLCLQILRKVQNDSIISVLTHFYMQNDRSYDESRLSVL